MATTPDEQKNPDEKIGGAVNDDDAATTSTENPGDGDAGAGPDKGYPDDTPVAEMTAEQQAAYWKHMARKHENTAKARRDYDDVVAERDELKRATMTDGEKALAEARNRGRAEALTEAVRVQIDTHIDSRVTDTETADILKAAVNPSTFVDGGTIKTDALTAYLNAVTLAKGDTAPVRDPHQGNRNPAPTRVSGRDRYAARYNKKTN